MIALEKQVCGLELARQLKELGVKQESLWWHWATEIEIDGLTWWNVSIKEPRKGKRIRELPGKGKISAFTAGELITALPAYLHKDEKCYKLTITKYLYQYNINYRCDGNDYLFPVDITEDGENLSNALAKGSIYLIANKLIDMEGAKA